MAKACPSCGIVWTTDVCPECAESPGSEPRDVVHARAVAVPVRIALLGALLNLFVWPGLGSLVMARQVGWAQGLLVLAAVGFLVAGDPPIALVLAGAAWLWAAFTALDAVNLARRPARTGFLAAASEAGVVTAPGAKRQRPRRR